MALEELAGPPFYATVLVVRGLYQREYTIEETQCHYQI